MLLQLVEEEREVPASVTELYDRFTDTVLGRDDKQKGILVLFEYLVKKRFLAALAYHEFLKKDRLTIPRSDFNAFQKSYAREYGLTDESLDDFAREIERADLLDLRDEVEFKHRSFLDYFTAFHLFHRRDEIPDLPPMIVDLYFSDVWADVAFFFVGLKRELTESMLTQIIERDVSGIIGKIDKFNVGRLLQAGWHSPKSVKTYGIREGFALLPAIKEEFKELTKENRQKYPTILADFFALSLSRVCFRSRSLSRDLLGFYQEVISGSWPESLAVEIPLLGILRDFVDPTEFRELLDQCLDRLKEAPVQEQAAALIMLPLIETDDAELKKSLKRRLLSLRRRYPEVLKNLLPPRRKGFRQKGRKALK